MQGRGRERKSKNFDFWLGLLRLTKTVGGLNHCTVGGMKFFKGKVVFCYLVRCQ